MKKEKYKIILLLISITVIEVYALIPGKPCTSWYQQKIQPADFYKPGTIVIAWKMPEEIKEGLKFNKNFTYAFIFKSYESEKWRYFTSITIKGDPVFNRATQESLIKTYIKHLETLKPYLNGSPFMITIAFEESASTSEADDQDIYQRTLKGNVEIFKDRFEKEILKLGYPSISDYRLQQNVPKKPLNQSIKVKNKLYIGIGENTSAKSSVHL